MTKVPNTTETEGRCICSDCPSFPGDGGLYCARGKSQNPVRRRGCVCPDCRNFRDYSLEDSYYCADGAAGEGPK